jgi:hypothetical protein
MSAADPRLIRLITRRFRELQGLGTVLNAGWLLLFYAGLHCSTNRRVLVWFGAFAVYAIGSQTWLRWRIERYYTTRFGRVGDRTSTYRGPGVDAGAWVLLPVLLDSEFRLWALGAAITIVLIGSPLWIVLRDWPYRRHWLLPACVGGVVCLRLTTVEPLDRYAWALLAAAAGFVCVTAAGLLDHALLVKTLARSQADEDPIQAPKPSVLSPRP